MTRSALWTACALAICACSGGHGGDGSGAGSAGGAPASASASTSATTLAGAGSATSYAFVDVTVVPMDSEVELAHQTVLVEHGRITAIGSAGTTLVPASATAIPGAGKWLVPGLIDMHVHFNDEHDGLLYVANGVTTVRNMWGFPQNLDERERAKRDDPSYVGPAVYTAGPIVDGDPPVWPTSHVVHDAKEADAEVAAQKAAGYDFIKVYDNLTLPAYDALVAAAKRAGLRFAGHVPKAVGLAHALAAGQASIEHLTGYLAAAQDASSKASALTGDAQRIETAKHLDASKLPALAQQTADAHLANCPTLIVLNRFAELEHPDPHAHPEIRFVSPMISSSWTSGDDFRAKGMTHASWQALRDMNAFRAKVVKALADAGAPLLAGTDTGNPFVVAGFSLHDELALLVGAGLTPYQALAAATANAATWIGDRYIGRIEVGGRADLVLLDADPLTDIAAITHRSGVMLRGHWHPQAELAAQLEALAKDLAAEQNPLDLFAKIPALLLPPGSEIGRATYVMSLKGKAFGAERFAITKTPDGGRTLAVQSVGFAPMPPFADARIELDKDGRLAAFAVDAGNQHASATRAGDQLHVEAGGASHDEALPPDTLLGTESLGTWLPFLARAADKAKTHVAGKTLDAAGKLEDIAFDFDRTASPIAVSVTSPEGTVKGTLELDAAGLPTTVTLALPFGTLTFSRQ